MIVKRISLLVNSSCEHLFHQKELWHTYSSVKVIEQTSHSGLGFSVQSYEPSLCSKRSNACGSTVSTPRAVKHLDRYSQVRYIRHIGHNESGVSPDYPQALAFLSEYCHRILAPDYPQALAYVLEI